mgnify:CR=1 FL=1
MLVDVTRLKLEITINFILILKKFVDFIAILKCNFIFHINGIAYSSMIKYFKQELVKLRVFDTTLNVFGNFDSCSIGLCTF